MAEENQVEEGAVAFDISNGEVRNFLLAALVMTLAFTAFFKEYEAGRILFFGTVSLLILGVRELAHRTIAYFMTAYVELEFSTMGALLSIMAAIGAVGLDLPLIILLPVSSSFSNVRYESWGYEIDVVWSKREYWFAAFGILALTLLTVVTWMLGYTRISLSTALFTLYQLLPLKETNLIEGSLDGAYILLYSGFVWLLFVGVAVVGIAVSL